MTARVSEPVERPRRTLIKIEHLSYIRQARRRLLDDRIGVQTECVCCLGVVGAESIESCACEIRRTQGGSIVAGEALEKTGAQERTRE